MAKSKSSKGKTLAEQYHKYDLYQKSVQSPEHEVEFFDQVYNEAFGRKPISLREDFCGTFAICCEWVKSGRNRVSTGVDLDPEPLEWGKENNYGQLTDAQKKRVRIIQQDVRKINRPQVDVLAAQNFSFWIFKTRAEVVEYFKIARANLKKDGVMVMDMMGGSDCFVEDHTDKRTIVKGKRGFKYYWHQAKFDPITHDTSFYISFKFKDGSRFKNAFEYHWRFWSTPEVREMLEEAGFSESHVYWEDTDEDGEDLGTWSRATTARNNPSWISYLVAIK